MDRTLTWEDAVEDLQFIGILPPQTQHIVLPTYHLSQNKHDWDGGQPDKEEQWISPFHHVQPLLMANHLAKQKPQSRLNLAHSPPECEFKTGVSLCVLTCITVTAPYVTAVQQMEPTMMPAAANGHALEMSLSARSSTYTTGPAQRQFDLITSQKSCTKALYSTNTWCRISLFLDCYF